jgi:hypothetical protein
MLMVEALPELSDEIVRLLLQEGEDGLAHQVPRLHIVDRCRCGDDFCSCFYTAPKPSGGFGLNHRNVELHPDEGMLILDVVDDRIHQVEVLFRDEVRSVLNSVMP